MKHDPLCTHWNATYKWQCVCPILFHARQQERAVAVRDAIEAVKAAVNDPRDGFTRSEFQCCGTSAPEHLRDTAIEAIEALGQIEDSISNLSKDQT